MQQDPRFGAEALAAVLAASRNKSPEFAAFVKTALALEEQYILSIGEEGVAELEEEDLYEALFTALEEAFPHLPEAILAAWLESYLHLHDTWLEEQGYLEWE